jgi:hypothetical protein
MSDYNCNECGALLIDTNTNEIIGCPHFPKDDLTEYSGKLMSDAMSQAKADWQAIQALHKAAQRGKQESLFYNRPDKP